MPEPVPDAIRDAIRDAHSALKRASSLYALGYNERHAETCPGETDESGTTRQTYRDTADGLIAMVLEAKDRLRPYL